MKLLEELARGTTAVVLGYISTMREICAKYNIPDEEYEEMLTKHINKWREILK